MTLIDTFKPVVNPFEEADLFNKWGRVLMAEVLWMDSFKPVQDEFPAYHAQLEAFAAAARHNKYLADVITEQYADEFHPAVTPALRSFQTGGRYNPTTSPIPPEGLDLYRLAHHLQTEAKFIEFANAKGILESPAWTEVLFYKRIAGLVELGVSLQEALHAAADLLYPLSGKPAVEAVIDALKGLKRGSNVADAFAQAPHFFNRHICSDIRRGDAIGSLDQALALIAIEKESVYRASLLELG